MSVAAATRTENFYFGFSDERLFLRLDARGGPVRRPVQRHRVGADHVLAARPIRAAGVASLAEPIVQMYHHDVPVAPAVKGAGRRSAGIGRPRRSLAVTQGDPVHLYLELIQGEQVLERIPHEGAIETAVPSPDYR